LKLRVVPILDMEEFFMLLDLFNQGSAYISPGGRMLVSSLE
jgi:hypothetical protein